MKREYLRTALFTFCVFALTFALSEAGARILHLAPRSLITLDSCVGYKLEPSAHGVSGGPGGIIALSSNSVGFRDMEHTEEKSKGTYRVLFLGDSYTEALQVPVEDTFWRVLQKQADKAQLPLEVISMSVSSWSTGQEMRAYECYGRPYKPDLVVLAFNTDDLSDNAFRQDPFTPTFAFKNGTLVSDETYKTNIEKRLRDRTSLYPGMLYTLKDHSELLRYLYFTHANNKAGKATAEAQTTSEDIDAAWELTEALVLKLAHDVKADHAQFLLVHVPLFKDTSSEPLRVLARAHGLPLLDLTSALDIATTTPLHWPGDPHLTSAGHGIVGDVLFDTITSRYIPTSR